MRTTVTMTSYIIPSIPIMQLPLNYRDYGLNRRRMDAHDHEQLWRLRNNNRQIDRFYLPRLVRLVEYLQSFRIYFDSRCKSNFLFYNLQQRLRTL